MYNTRMKKLKSSKVSLHRFIAEGGNVKNFVPSKGISNETVPNIKKSKK